MRLDYWDLLILLSELFKPIPSITFSLSPSGHALFCTHSILAIEQTFRRKTSRGTKNCRELCLTFEKYLTLSQNGPSTPEPRTWDERFHHCATSFDPSLINILNFSQKPQKKITSIKKPYSGLVYTRDRYQLVLFKDILFVSEWLEKYFTLFSQVEPTTSIIYFCLRYRKLSNPEFFTSSQLFVQVVVSQGFRGRERKCVRLSRIIVLTWIINLSQ